jgi:GT2 family glycosyltransferase
VALFEPADLAERFDDTIAEHGTVDPDWERKVEPVLEEFGDSLKGLELAWFLGSTGNLSAPRQAVQEVDGFDEGYVGYGMEDTDFCYALSRTGATAQIDRQAANFHQLHPKPGAGPELRRNLRYFARKHDRLEARLFLWWFAGGVDIRMANQIALAAKGGRAAADPVLAALDKAVAELLQGSVLA